MDHEAVKLEFFRRVHNKNPPFRVKRRLKPREIVEIPEMVEWHYKNPPSLLPSHRDIVRCDNIKKRGLSTVDFIKPSILVEEVVNTLGSLESARKKLKVALQDMNVLDIFDDDFLAEVEEAKKDEAKNNKLTSEIMEIDEENKNKLEASKITETSAEEPIKDIEMKEEDSKNVEEPKLEENKEDIKEVDVIVEFKEIKVENESISLLCDETIEAVDK